MAADDYRLRIREHDEPDRFIERLGLELGDEAAELARELEQRKLAVSRGDDEIFVYAGTRAEAERARSVVEAVLADLGVHADVSPVEQWLDDEDRWDDEPPGETWEEEELEHGHAPWEVRVQARSRDDAKRLEEQLLSEGHPVVRLFDLLVVGAASRQEAEELAGRVHGEVEPGGAVVWETVPGNPFAIFGGMGSFGTPTG
jgi:hypothetical protein